MTPENINLVLYLLFWSFFALGTVVTFTLAAALVSVLDEHLPGGCPAQLRHLTWMLTPVWSASMFMEGINFSRPYIAVAF